MKDLIVVGVSHRTAPIEIRERLAFPEDRLATALERLRRDYGARESMIVSTCNRVEVIVHHPNQQNGDGVENLKRFLYAYHRIEDRQLDPYFYAFSRQDAVRHIFRVASSLDSMVVGEPQILAQLKQAYRMAHQAGSVGHQLRTLLPRAFFVAKRVRTETRVANAAVSVSSVAVELARKIFGDLSGKSILMLGAGKMGQLAARNLLESGISEVLVSNRTVERAHEVARRFRGSVVPFEDLDDSLVRTDIVLVSTGSDTYVLDKPRLLPVIRRRKYQPLFVIDISVPRNVDPQVNEIENIFLYDIDDLQSVISSNLDERQKEAQVAEEIVKEEVENFFRRLSTNPVGPLISSLRNRVEEICLEELEKNRHTMSPDQYAQTERILRLTAHRLAHPLIMKLKETHGNPGRRLHNIELIKEVFDLDEKE